MYRKGILLVSFAALTLVLAGCEGNLFFDIDQPDVPSTDDVSSRDFSDGSSATDDDVNSFIEEIDELSSLGYLDSETSVAAADELSQAASNDSLSSSTRQKAAQLAGSMRIQSNDNAFQLVNNVGTILTEFAGDDSGSSGEETSPEELMSSLVPDGLDEASFTEMVNILTSAATDFSTFASLIPTDTDGNVDETSPDFPEFVGGEKGDVIQMAMLSLAVNTAKGALTDSSGDGDTTDELYQLYSDVQAGIDPTVQFDENSDPFADIENGTGDIGKYLQLAGLDFSSDTQTQ